MKQLRLYALLASLALCGCASTIPAAPPDERAPTDPWEGMNRSIGAFNDNLDRATFKPLAKGYQYVMPDFAERGIGNFFLNLRSPMFIVNNILQGDLRGAGIETSRFLANSTLGLGGLLDVGTDVGWESQREDFGQTLAVWGVPDGPYVVLPIFGPHTLRDAFAVPVDYVSDPVIYVEHDRTRYTLRLLEAVDVRARLFTAEALIEDSFDRYLTIRESYLQNRAFNIYDGDPPLDDDFYDDFYDDFEDPDEFEE